MASQSSDASGVRRRPRSTALHAIAVAAGLIGGLAWAIAPPDGASAASAQTDLVGPAGGKFGSAVAVLPNGNYVVTDPGYDQGADLDVGAAYLYNGTTNTVISAITGSSPGDSVGGGGVIVLANGDYVVRSPSWSKAGVTKVGAVTWGSATTGVSGTVNTTNSLHGTVANDFVGSNGVTALTNGNYVVNSPQWAASELGAVTWANGATGITGPVTTTNSLTGITGNDSVGSNGVTALSNGNYVVNSPLWALQSGAVTWGNGAIGARGGVTTTNSIYGSSFGYLVGIGGVTALTNGNYVVVSWFVSNIGAVTWGNGATGSTGAVSIANSMLGSSADDLIGSGGVTALSNGNYVVRSPAWYNTVAGARTGAVTWGNGAASFGAALSTNNSLFGTYNNDRIGDGGVTALTNGNYVVSSPSLDSASNVDIGAVTWCDGTTGRIGQVNQLDSLYGTVAGDSVGYGGVTALTNGNYVVSSLNWGANDVGAVTWANGSSQTIGPITTANSLYGSTAGDHVGLGQVESVTALTNGNYTVTSKSWDNGPIANVGAITWGNGVTGVTGPVSDANSLHGSSAGDYVGFGGVTALTNSNFVVNSPYWTNGAHAAAGAVTWGNGATGITGSVGTGNSLFGTADLDQIGGTDLSGQLYGVVALADGNYAVSSPTWDNGSTGVDAGAVTLRTGTSSSPGAVSAANSAVGTPPGQVGRASASRSTSGAVVIATTQNRVLLMSDALYVAVVPARLMETRVGPEFVTVDGLFRGAGTLAGGGTVALHVGGRGGVPADAAAAALNVTAVNAQGAGFVTVWPCGEPRPNASSLNYVRGQTVPNAVVSKIGTEGNVCLFSQVAIDLVVDVNGFFPAGSVFRPLTPARLLETRSGPGFVTADGQFQGGGTLPGGGTIDLHVGGRGGVPAGAAAAVLNVTAVDAQGPGFVTVWPCGESRPNASSLNYVRGQTVPNAVIAKIGATGDVCVFSQVAIDLVVDVNGFFPAGSAFGPLTPARLMESRIGSGFVTVDGGFAGGGVVAGGGTVELQVAGRGGVPVGATAAVLNVTAVDAKGPGFLTVWPCGEPRPTASSLNYSAGQTVPNAVITKIGINGTVCLFTQAPIDLVVDVTGSFSH